MANLSSCPLVTLDQLDVTGATAGDHLVFNSGSGEIEFTADVAGVTMQPLLTANGAAVAFGHTPVDSSTIAITVTSPASPVANDCFIVSDGTANAGTNNITIDFGTDNLNGSTGAWTINCDGEAETFKFVDNTTGWVIT